MKRGYIEAIEKFHQFCVETAEQTESELQKIRSDIQLLTELSTRLKEDARS